MNSSNNRFKSFIADCRGNSTNTGYVLIIVLVVAIAVLAFVFLNVLMGADNPAGYNTEFDPNVDDDGGLDIDFGGGGNDDGTIRLITGDGDIYEIEQPVNESKVCDEIGPTESMKGVWEGDNGDTELLFSEEFEDPKACANTPDPSASGDTNVSIEIG
ncbi:hypothetical protein ACFQDD_00975 [Halorubrum pallidum]|uniref:Archaeal Type IV pilin N-terminal domain-containing protein n=1 Tax=Halorubrum pallidum TaxID=1526114 RepID=A0ABD5SYS2_9EURY